MRIVATWTFGWLYLLSFLTLATPLTFQDIRIRNIVFLTVIAFAPFVSKNFKNIFFKNTVKWSPVIVTALLAFASLVSFANHITGGWNTVWISHRNRIQPTIYVGEQMIDIGARGYAERIVKVTPITPLLNWTITIDTTTLGRDWVRVSEHFNPFDWK